MSKYNAIHFKLIFEGAQKVAQAAGERWMAEHQNPAYLVKDGFTGRVVGSMLDVCGRCYVQVDDRRSAFAKWAKANDFLSHKWLHLRVPLEMRQEMGLHEAMSTAARDHLAGHGIKGLSLYSWID